jgi:hypothetical protein
VLNSLQQTAETLLVKTANSNAELELARSARFEKLEAELRTTLTDERTKLYAELDSQRNALLAQEKALSEKQASFNTKEARYVARQKQEEQITQIQEWLKDWTLTKGTARKRWPIVVGYVVALLGTGILTWYATAHNYSILKSTDDLTKLQWWHWVLLTSKSFFPLAAFTTFMVYFIRWSSAWARQHSEEEFRNRTRLVDIGRSSWLLEAVRDAQDKGTQIPPELLKELSRNLFSTSIHPDGELAPQALSEVLLQGLSSLRVKSPDGSEIEATRKKL